MESIEDCVLPVIDLRGESVAEEIYCACKEFGFFVLTNHGVDSTANIIQLSKAFFNLPIEIKKACAGDHSGYSPPFSEILDPANQSVAESKEGYYIFRQSHPDEIDPSVRKNIWPEENKLPGWKSVMLQYYDSMMLLGLQISEHLAKGLGLEPNFFSSHFSHSMSVIKLLHYTSEKSDISKGVFAAGAHSDYGLLTFLLTDDVPGLQVRLNETWYNVKPQPGNFIVNLGDMLQRWTNNHLMSTLHRVVNAGGTERYSIPFFFEPNFNTRVECLPKYVTEEYPAQYGPITSGEHLLDKYRQTAGAGNKF